MTEAQERAAIDHMQGKEPKFHKGKYGKNYDYHTCGNCGRTIIITDNYCPKCGTRILWDNPRCLTGVNND
jgi:uncharacterized OB-fold protein